MFSNIGTRHLLLVNVRSYDDDDDDDDNNNNMYSDLFKVVEHHRECAMYAFFVAKFNVIREKTLRRNK